MLLLMGMRKFLERRLSFLTSKASRVAVFLLIAFFNFYEYLLRISPSVMTSDIMSSYDLSAVAFGNLSAIFYYIYSPLQFVVGILMDRYGPRYLLPTASFFCAVGALLFFISDQLWLAQIGRFLIGFGSAFAYIGGIKFIVQNFSTRYLGALTGVLFAICQMGGMFGQALLGFALNYVSWEMLYSWLALGGLFLALLLLFMSHYSNTDDEAVGVTEWQSVRRGFKEVLKTPLVWLIGVIASCLFLPTSVFAELWGVSYLKAVYGFTNVKAAYACSMIFVGWAVGAPFWGYVSDYWDRPRFFVICGAICSFILCSALIAIPFLLKAYIYLTLFFVGFFVSSQMLELSIIYKNIPAKIVSMAIALLNTLVLVGGMIFQPLVGLILDWRWSGEMFEGVRFYSATDYRIALMAIPLIVLLGLLLSCFLRRAAERCFVAQTEKMRGGEVGVEVDSALLSVDKH